MIIPETRVPNTAKCMCTCVTEKRYGVHEVPMTLM